MTDKHTPHERVFGSDLKIGDALFTWRDPDTITALRPYAGPLDCFNGGARIATFGRGWEMTIENGGMYTRAAIAKAEGK